MTFGEIKNQLADRLLPELETKLKEKYNMKTFNTDKPVLRTGLLLLGVFVAALTGAVTGLLLFGTIVDYFIK